MTIQLVVRDLDELTDEIIQSVKSSGVKDVEVVEPGARSTWLTLGLHGVPASWQCYDTASIAATLQQMQAVSDTPVDLPGATKVYYDVEVYPNLFVICWKEAGEDKPVHHVVNPPMQVVQQLIQLPLVGFNNRKYDNHIMLAAAQGESVAMLYARSKRLTTGKGLEGTLPAAYSIGYTDVYDYANMGNKKSLKMWEIDLGIHHDEMDISWDQPVPEHLIPRVVEYCTNDVLATEQVDNHLKADWAIREILCDLAGLPPISSTNQLSGRIIFGDLKKEESPWQYFDLSKEFPGYEYHYETRTTKKAGQPVTVTECVSTYKNLVASEGGYVYTNPGIFHDVALLDISSMHPSSLINMACFGPYTERYKQIRDARLLIKHLSAKEQVTKQDKIECANYLNGVLVRYLDLGSKMLKDLADALKIVINSVYGQTAARHANIFNGNSRNREANPDNIVAKRGSLFMIALQTWCQERGWTVVHIKTDSIKLANATPEMIAEVSEFGRRYGYDFEHEDTYDRMVLVNKAEYAAHNDKGWHFTGASFLHPYVRKRLFHGEQPVLSDCREKKSVAGGSSMYLGSRHVGRVGSFVPVIGGQPLVRVDNGKTSAVSGTKGWGWCLDSEVSSIEEVDTAYHEGLVSKVAAKIAKFGDCESFIQGDRKEPQ